MLNFCDFIQVYVFTTNHHLKKNTFMPDPIEGLANITKNRTNFFATVQGLAESIIHISTS